MYDLIIHINLVTLELDFRSPPQKNKKFGDYFTHQPVHRNRQVTGTVKQMTIISKQKKMEVSNKFLINILISASLMIIVMCVNIMITIIRNICLKHYFTLAARRFTMFFMSLLPVSFLTVLGAVVHFLTSTLSQ